MEKRNIVVARQLQIGDPIFVIVAKPIDDHLGKKSNSNLEYFDVVTETVFALELDKNRSSNVVINEQASVPLDGKFGENYDNIILNEETAHKAVVSRIKKELAKAEAIVTNAEDEVDRAKKEVEKAKAELKGVESNLAVFEGKSTLNKKGTRAVFISVPESKEDE